MNLVPSAISSKTYPVPAPVPPMEDRVALLERVSETSFCTTLHKSIPYVTSNDQYARCTLEGERYGFNARRDAPDVMQIQALIRHPILVINPHGTTAEKYAYWIGRQVQQQGHACASYLAISENPFPFSVKSEGVWTKVR